MKKVTLILASAIMALSATAQYKPIVDNDPSGDAGMMGIDVKNLSYALSADKKNVTFKFEMHTAVSSWDGSGFVFYIDEDLNPSTGIIPDCANKSLKADRSIMIVNMMGMWSGDIDAVDASKKGALTGFTVLSPDNKTTLVTIPLDKIDADGKFNLLVGVIVSGSGMYIDDLPNSNYSKLDMLNTTSIKDLENKVSFTAYPNPAVNEVNFSAATNINGTIKVYDIIGKVVATAEVNGKTASIPVNQLNNGIYLFRVSGGDNTIVGEGRFSVQH